MSVLHTTIWLSVNPTSVPAHPRAMAESGLLSRRDNRALINVPIAAPGNENKWPRPSKPSGLPRNRSMAIYAKSVTEIAKDAPSKNSGAARAMIPMTTAVIGTAR